MKKNIIILGFILLISSSFLYPDTIIVDISGTGNYTTIQEGIDNSVNGDTVLVYPGTYYENINYYGNNITVASLYITTQADSFIHQTIIDGNQNGSVVTLDSGEDSTAILCGFTIVNGTGTMDLFNQLCGGGVFCKNSSPYIMNCNISDNKAYNGGGIFCRYADIILANNIIQNNNIGGGVYCTHSNITMSNNTIRYNHSILGGGGICFTMSSEGSFDSEERNSVYLNYAGQSNDIFGSSYCPLFEVLLDTATVITNLKDFIYFDNNNQPIIDILNGMIEPVNQNLFVSPYGSNENSGFTPDDPLKTVSWALINVASDSTHSNIIHLTNGVYSPELTDEKFPLNMRSYVSLIGESEGGTILNATEKSTLITCGFGDCKFQIKNLTLQNSVGFNSGSLDFFESSNVVVKNVTIKNSNTEGGGGGIYCATDSNPLFEKVTVINNTAEIGGGAWISSNPVFINCDISYNIGTDPYGGTGGIVCGGSTLLNCSLCDNNGQQYGAAYITSVTKGFINVTVSGHSNPQGAIHVSINQIFELTNCILWNDGNEIYYGSGGQSYVEISYSDIKNGELGIHTNGNGTYNWGDGNIDEDPFFVGGDPFSYELTKYSPCVDAGTPDTTGLHLPATDLAGNPRIFNGRIDIGTYECQDTVSIDQPDTSFIHNLYLFQNTPNPFTNETEILFITADYERVEDYTLSIYNAKGQLVRSFDGSTNNFWVKTKIVWDGKDEQGRQVAPGAYFYKLEYNGNAVVRKMVLLR